MKFLSGAGVQQDFQKLVVQLKQAHLYACAIALRWQGEHTAPWLADTALPRVLELHLTKALAAEHDKATLLFLNSGDVLLTGDGLSNAAYHRVQAALEDEAVKLGAHPASFTLHRYDLSVDWEAFAALCKELNVSESKAPAAPQAAMAKAPVDVGQLLKHLREELGHYKAAFAARSIPPSRKLTLLFVEDEPSIRQLLNALLADSGHELHFAANGRDAVYAYCRKPPHIVFLDINLPDISGLQILELLREADPMAYAVMLTSHAASGPVQTAIQHGAKHYVVKPFSRQKLQDCLERFFR